MKQLLGQIIQLYITPINETLRLRVNHLDVTFGGAQEDKFFGKENREILLSSTKSYAYAANQGFEIKESDLGENILTNFDVKKLQIGDVLEIGTSRFEVSMECPICNHLSTIDKTFPKAIKDDRGIFLKVLIPGSFTINDQIFLINKTI